MRDLVDSIRNALAAVKTHDDARDSYPGYEWGYHGHRERVAMDEAVKELEENIREIIRDEIKKVGSEQ